MNEHKCNHLVIWTFILGLLVGTAFQIAKLRERNDDLTRRVKMLELQITATEKRP